ncbi:precorrin-6A/cobalt-precorrin-6A reductase, partial [Pseudomonas sp.]|uniref:precorrin-6A/cobalt-precorrin-6A reductase n=1 Tax=Pseudomonas sp. TaxID=306 RepID=UPI003564AE05
PAVERAEIIGARGPFDLDGERALFARLQTDVLISKNSGSQATEPKLQVARELGLPVVLLRRPSLPPVQREFASLDALWQVLQEAGYGAAQPNDPDPVGWVSDAGCRP